MDRQESSGFLPIHRVGSHTSLGGIHKPKIRLAPEPSIRNPFEVSTIPDLTLSAPKSGAALESPASQTPRVGRGDFSVDVMDILKGKEHNAAKKEAKRKIKRKAQTIPLHTFISAANSIWTLLVGAGCLAFLTGSYLDELETYSFIGHMNRAQSCAFKLEQGMQEMVYADNHTSEYMVQELPIPLISDHSLDTLVKDKVQVTARQLTRTILPLSELTWTSVGCVDGTFVGVERRINASMLLHVGRNDTVELIEYEIDPVTHAVYDPPRIRAAYPYDLWQRGWFTNMEPYPCGFGLWTDVYYWGNGDLGISLLQKFCFPNGSWAGVSTADASLAFVSKSLTAILNDTQYIQGQADISPQQESVIIVDQRGHLISAVGSFFEESVQGIGEPILNNTQGLLKGLAKIQPTLKAAGVSRTKADIDGLVYYLTIVNVVIGADTTGENGLELTIFYLVPKGEIQKETLWTLYLTAVGACGLVFLGMVASIFSVMILMRPLMDLMAAMKRATRLELDGTHIPPGQMSYFTELYGIQSRTNLMFSALESFAKYVPRHVVLEVLQAGKAAQRIASKQEAIIFFLDIEQFTTLVEAADHALQFSSWYDQLFGRLVAICEAESGIVDKFIGDAIMCLWFQRRASWDRAHLSAINAAWAMRLYITNHDMEIPPLDCRVGINAGSVMVGNFGASNRLSYTAIGDGVNLASRLESLNKFYGTRILISRSMLDRTDINPHDHYLIRWLDRVVVRGRTTSTDVYEVMCPFEDASSNDHILKDTYEQAITNYFSGQILPAMRDFERVAITFDCKAAHYMTAQCEAGLQPEVLDESLNSKSSFTTI